MISSSDPAWTPLSSLLLWLTGSVCVFIWWDHGGGQLWPVAMWRVRICGPAVFQLKANERGTDGAHAERRRPTSTEDPSAVRQTHLGPAEVVPDHSWTERRSPPKADVQTNEGKRRKDGARRKSRRRRRRRISGVNTG